MADHRPAAAVIERLAGAAAGSARARGWQAMQRAANARPEPRPAGRAMTAAREADAARHALRAEAVGRPPAAGAAKAVPVAQPAAAAAVSAGGAPTVQLWSVALINKERDRIAKSDTVFGGEIALHHIIAREQIDRIVKVIGEITGQSGKTAKKWPQTIEAAKNFLTAVAEAAKMSFGKEYKEFNQQTGGRADRVLHNLPVNLVPGPKNLLGDAGTSFDPATVRKKDSKDDERVLDARSVFLQQVVLGFEVLEGARLEGDDGKAAQALKLMAEGLLKAVEKLDDPSRVTEIDKDEFFEHEGKKKVKAKKKSEVGETEIRLARKAPGTYYDAERGAEIFRQSRKNPGKIPADPVEIEAAPLGADRTLALSIESAQVEHIFKRHSYAHFDFGDLKLRNNFWPASLSDSQIHAEIRQLASRLHRNLLAQHMNTETRDLDDLKVNLQLPGMFAIALISEQGSLKEEEMDAVGNKDVVDPEGFEPEREPGTDTEELETSKQELDEVEPQEDDERYEGKRHSADFVVVVDTLSPEGADQYSASVLKDIAKRIG